MSTLSSQGRVAEAVQVKCQPIFIRATLSKTRKLSGELERREGRLCSAYQASTSNALQNSTSCLKGIGGAE